MRFRFTTLSLLLAIAAPLSAAPIPDSNNLVVRELDTRIVGPPVSEPGQPGCRRSVEERIVGPPVCESGEAGCNDRRSRNALSGRPSVSHDKLAANDHRLKSVSSGHPFVSQARLDMRGLSDRQYVSRDNQAVRQSIPRVFFLDILRIDLMYIRSYPRVSINEGE